MNKIISETEKTQNIILIVKDEKYQETIRSLIKELTLHKKRIVFVSINKTKNAIEKELKAKKIPTDKIYFIDCISKSISKGKIKWSNEKTQYVDNPTSLTQMSLVLFKLIERIKIDFLVLDSINTLLIYNSEKEILKFIHHTTGKLKENNITGIFIYLKGEMDEKLLKEFSQFADKVMEAEIKTKREFTKQEIMDSIEEIKL
jgi:archaellum biogenesis ATPase FlaH